MASMPSHGRADEKDESSESSKKFQKTEKEDYGYYFYPERSDYKEVQSFWASIWGRPGAQTFNCEANVTWCIKNREMVLNAFVYFKYLISCIFKKL